MKKLPLVNDFDHLFLVQFTTDNLMLFVLYCVSWRFSGRICNRLKNFLNKLSPINLPEEQVIFRDANSVSILNLGFLISRSSLLYRMDKNSKFLAFFGIKSTKMFSIFQSCKELSYFVKVLVPKSFKYRFNIFYQGS